MGNISNSMPSPLTNKLRDTIFEVSKFLESVYDKIHQGELSVEEAEKQLAYIAGLRDMANAVMDAIVGLGGK